MTPSTSSGSLTAGSLFTGIGGFDLGFQRAGIRTSWMCERDAACQSVLRKHWPGVQIYDDVRNVGRDAEPIDILMGGFPCQDVSIAGRRAGLAGERSGLWFEFHRILGELAPQWVVIENVPGLLSSNGGRDFATILHGLVELRYRVAWRVLDSKHFGVPQRRRRVFIVGHLGTGRAAEVLFEREGGGGHPAPGGEAGQGITASPRGIAGSGGPAGDEAYNLVAVDFRNQTLGDLSPTLQAKSTGGYSLNYTPGVIGTLAAGDYKSATDLVSDAHHPAIAFEPRYYSGRERMGGAPSSVTGPLKASDTHVGDSQQHVAANGAVRRLTPLECERLQGFPDGWTAGQSDAARYRQMGNAVTVNVAEWIGRRIVEAQS